MDKKTIQLIAFICLSITLLLAITGIAIAGVHFPYTNITWTDHGWSALGPTEIASMLLIWVIIGIGIAAFITMHSILLIVFAILTILSLIFTFAIVIFAFIGSEMRTWDESIGCNAEYNGIWSAWQSIDIYLQTVDALLCSHRCPCYFRADTGGLYFNNSATMPYIAQWDISDRSYNHYVRFQDCPPDVIVEAYNQYIKKNAYFSYKFHPYEFIDYFSRIEMAFKCTGFCGTTYYDENRKTSMKIVKYLFNDITQSVPEHNGCLHQLLKWLNRTLNAFAAVGCFIIIAQTSLLLIALLLLRMNIAEKIQSRKEKDKVNVNVTNKDSADKPITDGIIAEANKKVISENDNTAFNIKFNEKITPEEEKKLKDMNAVLVDEKGFKQTEGHLDEKDLQLPQQSSFVAPDAMMNENELRFNPSVNQT